MSNLSGTAHEFLNDHRIRVVDTNKRAHRHTKMDTRFFTFEDDYNKMLNEPVVFETEPLYTVEIAESEIERIASFETEVFNNMRSQGHYNMFETLMAQKEQEKLLRQKYVSVQKAYEQYSLMLKLAQSGEL